MPAGGGHQLGCQHSHSLEVLFMHTPGLKVVYPATPLDAKALLKAAIRDDNPVIFLEHEGLYGLKGEVPDDVELGVIGRAEVVREGADVTIVAYAAMRYVAEEAAATLAQEGIGAEVIDLKTLAPWDKETVMASVRKTGAAVVVSEAPPVCGVGAEIATNIYEQCFDKLSAPVVRVDGANVPLPYSAELEQAAIPHAAGIVLAARKALGR
jgi:pyruvate dehydrogenase E1 component beta subunit